MQNIIDILSPMVKEVELDDSNSPSYVKISPNELLPVCDQLHQHDELFFDMLSCVTGIDNGEEEGTMEVIYNLYSIPNEKSLMLKVILDRNKGNEAMPSIPSVAHIWKAAEWHEREIYDLFGIEFTNHPDLRRILMPADWEGHPLRKDYKNMERYRGMSVEYDRDEDATTTE